MATKITREQWLKKLVTALRPMFKKVDAPIPKDVLVSVGFPSRGGVAARKLTIGQCWTPNKKTPQIFISPLLADAVKVADVMVHELVHAAVGCEHGHKAPFARVAKALGLEGKMTATIAGKELKAKLATITKKLGKYPHEKLTPGTGIKKQTTRLVKAECPGCGYVARITRKWIDEVGLPICPECDVNFEEGV